jgi:hypothetical protein
MAKKEDEDDGGKRKRTVRSFPASSFAEPPFSRKRSLISVAVSRSAA